MIELSYFTCVFLRARAFLWHQGKVICQGHGQLSRSHLRKKKKPLGRILVSQTHVVTCNRKRNNFLYSAVSLLATIFLYAFMFRTQIHMSKNKTFQTALQLQSLTLYLQQNFRLVQIERICR